MEEKRPDERSVLYRRLWEQMKAFKVCFKRRCVAIDCNAVRVLMFGLGSVTRGQTELPVL